MSVYTVFNRDVKWNLDCNFYYTFCFNNNYLDIHSAAAHEFSHWFVLYDTYNGAYSELTMYGYSYKAEYKKRDLTGHDKTSACVMYGYQGGGAC